MATQYTGRLPDGKCIRVTVDGSLIKETAEIEDDPSLPYILPVLVDLQHNGALGTYYNELGITSDENGSKLEHIADYIRRHGTGRCLLTLTTFDYGILEKTAAFLDRQLTGNPRLEKLFFGIFHEGVFISPLPGWRGAHAEKWIMKPDYKLFAQLNKSSGDRVKLVNIAPEEPEGLDFIRNAAADGIQVSLGHCCPSGQIISEAVRRGARFVTHFGNGTAPEIHRFRNPLWSYLASDKLKTGIICDGIHLPDEIITTVLKCKKTADWFPVSDASGYSGCAPGQYKAADGRKFTIEQNGYMHLTGLEILSGAWFQLNKSVETLVTKHGFSFLDAWKQCSEIPAAAIGIDLPAVREGEEASFVVAEWNKGVKIHGSVHNGVYFKGPDGSSLSENTDLKIN
jgi:N-acetylglucosamine-6-phosphate deacetylase